MRLPKYVMIENKQEMPMPAILGTTAPYLVGKIIINKREDTEATEGILRKIANEELPAAKVPGYSIFIVLAGSMTREFCSDKEMKSILREMADFYLKEKITPHPFAYRKSEENWVPTSMREG